MLANMLLTLPLLALTSAAPTGQLETRAADVYAGPAGSGTFQLLSLTKNGDRRLSGFWIAGLHTGAGDDILVATANQTRGLAENFNTTDGGIYFQPTNLPPYELAFVDATPYMSDAPAGYKLVSQTISNKPAGLSFDAANRNTIVVPQQFHTFALCNVNATAPYFSQGADTQLFWRAKDVEVERHGKCADVLLQAIFNH